MIANLSIKRKLTLIIVLTTACALGLASSILITRSARLARAQMIEDLGTVADIIGNNSQAALSFQDATDAAGVLAALHNKPIIQAACLYQPDGHILADYRGPLLAPAFRFPPLEAVGHRIQATELEMFRPVVQDQDTVGYVYLNADLSPMQRATRRYILWALLITLTSMLLANLLAHRLQRGLISQINEVVRMADTIAEGDLPPRLAVTTGDEIGALKRSFNQMADTAREMVRQAQTLAQGDYSILVRPRSPKDALGEALIKMTQALKAYHEQSEKLNWIKTNLSELNDRMRGEQELPVLLERILSSLAISLEAQVGALYLATPDGHLRLSGGFALAEDRAGQVFAPGEGVIGQVAHERRPLLLRGLQHPDLVIHAGLARIQPASLAVIPLVREQEVIGVLELGKIAAFTEDQMELLNLGGASIAIAIHSAQARARLKELLDQTRRQSQILQEQQAVLHRANAELEERNVLLEKQKQEIHRQNTELESARLDLERKARELEVASQYKSDFLANVSHELRTPLNSLLILSRLLADNKGGNLTPKQVDFARTINKSGSDLLTLINDILDLSKVEAGKLEITREDTRLAEVVANLESIFRPLAEQKRLSFTSTMEAGLPATLCTDSHRLAQILRNLLSNAFKFTHQGSVTLRVFKAARGPGAGQDGTVGFAVHDSGIGIPKEKQALIFNAFQQADGTTSREYGGTGLGLAISRELAVRLGGDIVLDSEPGQGSTFTLYLPLAAQVPSSPAPPPPAPTRMVTPALPDDRAQVTPGQRSLLVIEDDPAFASIVMEFARARGFACLAASNGEDGLRLAEQFEPSGIILDIMLPGLEGREVLHRLKSSTCTRHIPVQLISALDRDAHLIRQGAIGFLTKPVTQEQMESALARIEGIIANPQKTLLVVEDDETEARGITRLLNGPRIRVRISPTGQDALQVLEQEHVDGIVLDLNLAERSGWTLLERIVEHKKDRFMPVIVHTSRALNREEESRLRTLAECVIIKGEHSPDLLREKALLYLHVPAAPAPASPTPAAKGTGSALVSRGTLKGRRVLIVDDDMRNAYSLCAILEQEGLQYELASDGRKALAKLAVQPEVDAILMDIMMPGMDGYEATREIRNMKGFQQLPIIALTAKAMAGDREKCLAAGATDYLPKPVDVDRLLNLLQELIKS